MTHGRRHADDREFHPRVSGEYPPISHSLFDPRTDVLDVDVARIDIHGTNVPFADAVIVGRAHVSSTEALANAMRNGVGRGRAYGSGLLLVGK